MTNTKDRMGLPGAVSIGVGTMIGASIFSVFGLGAEVAGHNLPLVFLLSGVVALLVAYSYATLGSQIISNAGPIEFVLRGFGDGIVAGALSILLWLTYVVSIALFAKGFAGYLVPLAHLRFDAATAAIVQGFVIAFFVTLNLFGAKAVGRAEFYIVLFKLSVLALFVVLGVWTVKPDWIRPHFGSTAMQGTLNATAIFFLSYMGFGLITNASEHIERPERNVPRAIYLSILIVTAVYVSVAVVAFGNLPLEDLIQARDNALAAAAEPLLGQVGYLLVSVGALASIGSALNATLYGGANVAYALAKDGELPPFFQRKLWFQAPEGLYLTAGLGLLFALLFDLNGVASITSAAFMVIYLFVLLAHYRLAGRYGGRRTIVVAAIIGVSVVFLILLHYQWATDRAALYGTLITLAACALLEVAYRQITKRVLVSRS
jgi:amino acid transporter